MINQSDLCFWWPYVKDASVAKPKTIIVEIGEKLSDETLWNYLNGKHSEQEEKALRDYFELLEQAAQKFQYPIFFRSSLTAAKHQYNKSCYLERPQDIPEHFLWLLEDAMLGPGILPRAFVVREFIPLIHKFKAFKGLPIGPEMRVFACEGVIACMHNYWPIEAIKFYAPLKPPSNWQQDLEAMYQETANEGLITVLKYAELLSQNLPPIEWSLDFAKGEDGNWYFIDAAIGSHSYHPKDCLHKDKRQ